MRNQPKAKNLTHAGKEVSQLQSEMEAKRVELLRLKTEYEAKLEALLRATQKEA